MKKRKAERKSFIEGFGSIPENPYFSEGITDDEFSEAVLNDRRNRKKRYGGDFFR